MNMGTPNYPEGLPHWTTKALLAQRLRRGMQNEGRRYATPFRRELRNINLPSGLSVPEGLQGATQRLEDRVDEISPLAFAIFDEPAHDGCEGGVMVLNLLEGMRGGRVECEKPFGNYIPDISLYRNGESEPHVVIEVVTTSEPTEQKKRFYEEQGIVAFVLHVGRDDNVRAVTGRPAVWVSALSNAPRGRKIREQIGIIDKYIVDKHANGESPFVGIKSYSSHTQEYIYGTYDPHEQHEWQWGDPEVYGFCPTPEVLNSPQMLTPLESRSISKAEFLAYMVIALERTISFYHECDTPQEKAVYRALGNCAMDLLDAVNVPMVGVSA